MCPLLAGYFPRGANDLVTGAAVSFPPEGHWLFLAHQMYEPASLLTATAPAALIAQA